MATPGGSRNTEFYRYVKKECVTNSSSFFKFQIRFIISAKCTPKLCNGYFHFINASNNKGKRFACIFFRMALQKAFHECHEINFLQTVFCVPIKQSLLNWVQPINCSCFCSFFYSIALMQVHI